MLLSQIVARQCVTHQTALPPQIAHNASWNANLIWLHAHAHNIRQPKSSSRRWPQIEGWLAFGAGLTRSLAPTNVTRAAYVAIRKLSDLTPEPTKAARLPPSTFALDELVSDESLPPPYSIPNSSAFHHRPPHVWRAPSDSSSPLSVNLSGNINPLVIPPPSSRYGPTPSKTKHPKSWAAMLGAKRRTSAATRYQERTPTTFSS